MQTILSAAAALGLSLTSLCFVGTAYSDEQTQAQRIISDAIQAVGGEAKLARFKAATWKSKGTLRIGDTISEFESDWAVHGSNQFRKAKTHTENGRESKTILVLNGDQAWFQRDNQRVVSFSGGQLTPARSENYTHWLALRLDIGKTARLSLLPGAEVDGRPALGVKVRDKGVPEVDLYFDKGTSLLTRMDTYITKSGTEAATETRVFRDYKETDGIKYASKVDWTGKNNRDLAVQREKRYDFKVHEELDGTLFAKP